jgi:hypothetical protein
MTYQYNFTLPTDFLEKLTEQGLDFLPELIHIVINTAMQVERQKHLGAGSARSTVWSECAWKSGGERGWRVSFPTRLPA